MNSLSSFASRFARRLNILSLVAANNSLSQNQFGATEKNPTIVTFPVDGFNLSDFVDFTDGGRRGAPTEPEVSAMSTGELSSLARKLGLPSSQTTGVEKSDLQVRSSEEQGDELARTCVLTPLGLVAGVVPVRPAHPPPVLRPPVLRLARVPLQRRRDVRRPPPVRLPPHPPQARRQPAVVRGGRREGEDHHATASGAHRGGGARFQEETLQGLEGG